MQEFIDAILTNKKDEWGEIKIKTSKRNGDWHHYFCIVYWYGSITNKPNIPEKVFGYEVKSVIASGGRSVMDYIVTLEKEVE